MGGPGLGPGPCPGFGPAPGPVLGRGGPGFGPQPPLTGATANPFPIGCRQAQTQEASAIDEGLDQQQLHAITGLPVLFGPAQSQAQDFGSQTTTAHFPAN